MTQRSGKILACLMYLLSNIGCQIEPSNEIKEDPQPYRVRKSSTPIVIDGRLDEAAWQGANTITRFYLFRPVDVPRLPATTVRLLWDSQYLYISFECEDDDIWSYSEVNDDPLYKGDVVELFIKPRRDSLAYYEFVIAPNGAIYDARYPSRGAGLSYRFGKWNSGARIASTLDGTDDNYLDEDQGYVVEIAIPLTAFSSSEQPSIDAEWTFGVFRYDFSKSYEDSLMLMSFPHASNQFGFHHYEHYAPLQFEE